MNVWARDRAAVHLLTVQLLRWRIWITALTYLEKMLISALLSWMFVVSQNVCTMNG